jgi:NADPH:quinone reductase-like Zn-dependent oxidoreductase
LSSFTTRILNFFCSFHLYSRISSVSQLLTHTADMATHFAVVTVSLRAPLQLISVPTPVLKPNEIRIRGEWTASTPLDLHQADGGLLVTHPQVLGDGIVGTVVEIGKEVKRFIVGDVVMGFSWRGQGEKAHQEFTVGEERLFGKVGTPSPSFRRAGDVFEC